MTWWRCGMVRLGRTKAPTQRRTRSPELIATWQGALDVRQIDESSFVALAESLYQAVCVWYARRNATGHYGRFIVDDPRQQAQGWYSSALLAADAHQSIGTWIRALQDTVSTCIDFEMATASKGPSEPQSP